MEPVEAANVGGALGPCWVTGYQFPSLYSCRGRSVPILRSENMMNSESSIVDPTANDPGNMPDSATDNTPGLLITSSFHMMPLASRARVVRAMLFCS